MTCNRCNGWSQRLRLLCVRGLPGLLGYLACRLHACISSTLLPHHRASTKPCAPRVRRLDIALEVWSACRWWRCSMEVPNALSCYRTPPRDIQCACNWPPPPPPVCRHPLPTGTLPPLPHAGRPSFARAASIHGAAWSTRTACSPRWGCLRAAPTRRAACAPRAWAPCWRCRTSAS